MAGWKQDISGCRKFEELPDNAKTYVKKIEQLLGKSTIFEEDLFLSRSLRDSENALKSRFKKGRKLK